MGEVTQRVLSTRKQRAELWGTPLFGELMWGQEKSSPGWRGRWGFIGGGELRE